MTAEFDSRDLRDVADRDLMDLRAMARAMRLITDRSAGDEGPPLEDLVTYAVELVPGARWASVTMLRRGTFTTMRATDPVAREADALQYRTGSGPCVDAALRGSLRVSGDVGADARWASWGRAAAEVGVRSVLCERLSLPEEHRLVAALNLYSDRRDAFDDTSTGVALILSTHATAVVERSLTQAKAQHLQRALETSRDIGVAIGILMHQHKLTRDEAFDLLRLASQNSNRRLADIALEVAETGVLELPRGRVPTNTREARAEDD